MKKFICMILLLSLCLLVFGCSANDSVDAGNTNQSVEKNAGGSEKEGSETEGSHGEEENFFEGKLITFIVPYDTGGGYDQYTRLIAPYLEKYTGATVVVKNITGAGGMKAINELYRSPKDGLTIGILNGNVMVTNQITGLKGARYELGKFGYLGRITADIRVLTVATDSPYETFEDIMNSQDSFIIGATGLGGSNYVDAVITGEALKLNQEVIHGFGGSSSVEQAIQRGDVHGMWGSWGSRKDAVESGLTKVVLQSGKERLAELNNVPTFFEIAEQVDNTERAKKILNVLDSLNSVGRPVATSPGVPQERLAFLQEAFKKAMEDPDFKASVEKAGRSLNYVSGAEILSIVTNATEIPENIKEIFIRAVKGDL